jgi:Leucine Rich repeat
VAPPVSRRKTRPATSLTAVNGWPANPVTRRLDFSSTRPPIRGSRQKLLLRLPAVRDNTAMHSEPPEADIPKRGRRWLQFSLRSLMIFVVLFAIACCWFGAKMEKSRRQQAAVDAIRKDRGLVSYENRLPPPQPAWLRALLGDDFFRNPISACVQTDAGLEHICEFGQLRFLQLAPTRFSNAGLQHLSALNRLESLNLIGASFSDASLEFLASLPQLRTLVLYNTPITNAGLAHLRGLKQLRVLDLRETRISDAGLEQLAALAQLSVLYVDSPEITDTGLEKLCVLKSLSSLDIRGTRVTENGVANLKRALPDCKIER